MSHTVWSFCIISMINTNILAADLKATFQLQILGVKKNPQSPMYTQLGVLTKGTVIEVNVSELGMVTTGGKVVFGKYAQITNNPENDGCINAVLCKFFCSSSTLSYLFTALGSGLIFTLSPACIASPQVSLAPISILFLQIDVRLDK